MRVTKWGEFGILCCMVLARKGNDKPVGAVEISDALKIPLQYTQQILQRLRKGDIITSVRGPHGGYLLSRSAQDTNLKDILFAAEGETFEIICETKPPYEACADLSERCGLFTVWKELKQTINSLLEQRSLASVIEEEGDEFLVPPPTRSNPEEAMSSESS